MKIACIGNATLDCTATGKEPLKADIRITPDRINNNSGGPAANAACVISKFGEKVDFYGQVGNDTNGKKVYEELLEYDMNLEHLNFSEKIMTPYSFVYINELDATRTIFSCRSEEDRTNATIENINYSENYDLILTDGKYVEESIRLITKNSSATSIMDAGRATDGVIMVANFVDYLICSEDFACEIAGGKITDDFDNNEKIFKYLKNYFPFTDNIVITIGKRGYICEKDGVVEIHPPYDSGIKAIDTNCAGDIFHGAFTYAMSKHYGFYKSLEFANITASISTTRIGGKASCPDLSEVEEILNNTKKLTLRKN